MEYKVVMSDAELEDLPKSLLDSESLTIFFPRKFFILIFVFKLTITFAIDDVEMLCSITSNFSSVDESELTAAYKPRPWNKLRGELY